MAEVSLYRKYRPQNFENLVGQDHIRTTLLNAFKNGNPAHAYLFCGPRGTGKTSTARLLAKALNCTNPTPEGEPCDKCEMCIAIRESNLIDLMEIDAASNRGIDEIRDLKDKINFAPTRAKNKIYIIDEVHMLTKEAFNALLKTLEEPPDHVFFVLATTEVHKVPETIISRCQRFDFKRIDKKAISTRLMYIAQMEGIDAEQPAIDAIAHIAEGGLRDAIGLFEQLTVEKKLKFEQVRTVLGISGQSALDSFYKYIFSNDIKGAIAEIHDLYAQGLDLIQFTKDFLEFLRQKMLNSTEQEDTNQTKQILKTINLFQEAYFQLKSTTIPQLPLEIASIKCTTIPNSNEANKPELKPEIKTNPNIKIERTHSQIKTNISEQERQTPSEKPDLTISYVKENWPRIIELIKTPFARMSFKEGRPLKVENGIVTIEFSSSFHKEKVDTTEIKLEIDSAIANIFKQRGRVEFVLGKVELTTEKQEPELTTSEKDQEPKTDLANEAINMFGGELIEEEQVL